MINLRIVAEGDSEEAFCKRLLIPHLYSAGVFATVSKVETSHLRRRPDVKFKGGVTTYEHVKRDIRNFLVHDSRPDLRVTTFIDYFHLPSDFPGKATERPNMTKDERIAHLESALGADISDARFLPYIQKHEFETFMFVDMSRLVQLYPGHECKVDRIARGAQGLAPEDVNGGDYSSPSMRIMAEFREHERNKPRIVPILEQIGLPTLRSNCPHFNSWVTALENMGGANA